ncbi:MAG: polysaccharide deacetylase family protein [Candidatus Omnitrophota bacterium]
MLTGLISAALAPFTARAAILLYHRVADLEFDPQLLCVKPKNFSRHLEYLQSNFQVLSLQALIGMLKQRKLPRRAVVITFDDGYADNLYNVKPLLKRYGMPATVFVTTGQIGREREFWWDELEKLLLQPGVLPRTISLDIKGKPHRWDTGEAAYYSKDDYKGNSRWNILSKDHPTTRHKIYDSLCGRMGFLSTEDRSQVLDNLRKAAAAEPRARSTHNTLSADEIVLLAGGGLVEIGSHGMTHTRLSCCTLSEQKYEITKSKEQLEKILKYSVSSFSYPYGGPNDYKREAVAIARSAGFNCACSSRSALSRQGSAFFQLPRILVRDYTIENFTHYLKECFRD